MYGIPEDLDLSIFQNGTLIAILLGEHHIQFTFNPKAAIFVEGGWELLDSSGSVIDQAAPNDTRSEYRVHVLLGKTVVKTLLDPPQSFSLIFDSGHQLTILDDLTDFESFSIQPGDIFV